MEQLTLEIDAIETRPAPTVKPKPPVDPALLPLERLNLQYEKLWGPVLKVENALDRTLVSFQANKRRANYRWFKFKEAFSADLIEFLLTRYGIEKGKLFDPFAGSGTALFAARDHGLATEGIELLPIGQRLIATKNDIDQINKKDFERLVSWAADQPWKKSKSVRRINELRITQGAYSKPTLESIGKFLEASGKENGRVKSILEFALLCILESISFTRKDGQYLRWDYRSGRELAQNFDKGRILPFDVAMSAKLKEITDDLKIGIDKRSFSNHKNSLPGINLHHGSCLEILPKLKTRSFDSLITSPPYCNRYDYTRTYALELALLGCDEDDVSRLRQEMLSCTVENRAKDLLSINPKWDAAIKTADSQKLLQVILTYLETQKELKLLNNGIPRMIRGYFYEMACVISECARILKPGAPFIMVNDNVRYAGVPISVDIILSDIAKNLGFEIEHILVLPNGKGNSSQQMGTHGRESLRKCVYVWRRV